jgi:hypothetical protein
MDVAAEARAFNNLGILRNLLGLPDEVGYQTLIGLALVARALFRRLGARHAEQALTALLATQ